MQHPPDAPESPSYLLPLTPLHRIPIHAGWFCCTKPLTSKVSLSILPEPGSSTWEEVEVEPDIKALVLMNLQVGVL